MPRSLVRRRIFEDGTANHILVLIDVRALRPELACDSAAVTRADAGGGAIAVALEFADQGELLPAHALSDGQLAWLCFVALYRLDSERSLLGFDEPELHMHPELLVRVVQLFEDMARTHPVILATHSDVLLDALSEPAKSVRVCELENGATRLRQLDQSALRKWMERYRGVGQLRSEGYLPGLLRDEATEP